MKRKKLLKAAESAADSAADSGKAVLDEAVQRITPLVEQAGDYVDEARKRGVEFAADAYDRVQPALETARKRGTDFATDTYERLEPALRDAYDRVEPSFKEAGRFANDAFGRVQPTLKKATKQGAKLAAETLDRVHPALDDALDKVTPAIDSAIKKVRPVVDDTLERVAPTVDVARDKVQNDFLPWLGAALYKAADLVKDELPEPKKKRSVAKTISLIALAGAVLAGVVYAVRRLLGSPDAGWETHEPSRPYVADPVADVVNKVKDEASDAVDNAKKAAAAAGEAVADKAEEVKDAVTDKAEDLSEGAAKVADDVQDAGAEALEKSEDAIDDAKKAAAAAAEDVQETASEVAGDAADAVDDAKDTAADAADKASDAVDKATDAATKDDKGDAAPLAESPYGEGSYVGAEPPEGYDIKGNERSMKYHLQGSGGYERTITDVWFSSTEAAEAAGFVRAQR